MPPITLAIDTAAPRLQLGLVLADGRTDSIVDDIAKGHAEILFERLDNLLARNGIGHGDIERIAVTTGPGSFTGLRIGLSAARGLGVARKIPVLGIPSLQALSLQIASGRVAIFLDARRDEAYFQTFSAPGIPEQGPRLLPIEEARAAIPQDATLIDTAFIDIVAMAQFAAQQDPGDYPPHASYVRDADAKPQNASRIPRRV